LLSGLNRSSLFCCTAGQRWGTHRKLLTPAFHFKVLENFVDVFNRNGKILVEMLSRHVNGPEFDVTPYMNLFALDNISGECRAVSLRRRSFKGFILRYMINNGAKTKGANVVNVAERGVGPIEKIFQTPQQVKCGYKSLH